MRIRIEAVKQILVVRNDRFGEFLLNIPAWRALKANYPQAKLTIVANPSVAGLVGCIKEIDGTLVWENRRHKLSEIWQFARQLKARHFDLCVIFNPVKEFNLISFLAGIPVRLGYNRKWAFLLTHKIKDRKSLGLKHEIDYNLELLAPLGIKTDDTSLSLKIENQEVDTTDIAVAVHPWTSDPVKQWPQERFYELTKILAGDQKLQVIIIGGKEELAKGADCYDTLGSNVVNLAGKTTLTELAGILKRVKLLISGDSGPVHLASCVATPVLALFRSDLAGKNSRRWGPVSPGSMVIEKPDLTKISVEEVYLQVKAFLER